MKIHHVKQARKSKYKRKCCTCGHEIERFEAYKYAEPYTGPKKFWCHKHSPKRSQLTQSKLSDVLARMEQAEESLPVLVEAGDIVSEVEEVAAAARECAEEYQMSLSAMPDQLQDSSSSGEMMQEYIDGLEQFADELECFDSSLDESLDTLEEQVEEMRERAQEAFNQFSL